MWDLRYGLPFPPATVHAAFLEHVLEHFTAGDALRILEHVHRALVPGGTVRVAVPDFGAYISSYAGDGSFIERNRPGRPTPMLAVGEVLTCHGHRSAWDGLTLVRTLEAAGFEQCAVTSFAGHVSPPHPTHPTAKTKALCGREQAGSVE